MIIKECEGVSMGCFGSVVWRGFLKEVKIKLVFSRRVEVVEC